jgi:hypothetical protein
LRFELEFDQGLHFRDGLTDAIASHRVEALEAAGLSE